MINAPLKLRDSIDYYYEVLDGLTCTHPLKYDPKSAFAVPDVL